MPDEVRMIDEGDRDALSRYLDTYPDTTLFLRSNLAEAGLRNASHPFGGVWTGCFAAGELVAVVAHFNGGNVVVAGGEGVEDAALLATRESARPVRGVVGPWAEANAVLGALALGVAPELVSREILYRLEIDRLTCPEALASGDVRCRASREPDLELLASWRVAFEVESLAKTGSAQQRVAARESITRAHDQGRLFVLEDGAGEPVASSAFNAWADGIAQVGGVFTPPPLRARGYGRSVVGGSLLAARERGAHRAVLFTGEDNGAARRAYQALGFEVVGDYGLLMF